MNQSLFFCTECRVELMTKNSVLLFVLLIWILSLTIIHTVMQTGKEVNWHEFLSLFVLGVHCIISSVKFILQERVWPAASSDIFIISGLQADKGARGNCYRAKWNCDCARHRLSSPSHLLRSRRMKPGDGHFGCVLTIAMIFLGLGVTSQSESSLSLPRPRPPKMQEAHRRVKRGWVWNQFFVLEEYTGMDPLYVGKVNNANCSSAFNCVFLILIPI